MASDTTQDDVYGLAANLAARVSGLAPPGAIVVSDAVEAWLGSRGGRWWAARANWPISKRAGRKPTHSPLLVWSFAGTLASARADSLVRRLSWPSAKMASFSS
jgi:hypothetical protein